MDETLEIAARLGREFLKRVGERPVGAAAPFATLLKTLGGPLPDDGQDSRDVVAALARDAEPGLVASAGPRYFGFVTGGALPAAVGADWLTSAWDQNAWMCVTSPAAAAVEEVAGAWLVDLLRLPPSTSVGFTTGATMANFSALAAARSAVLARCGHDVQEQGLCGAPEIAVVAGEAAHATIFAAVQMLGLGRARVRRVAVDEAGRMRPDKLQEALANVSGPTIVCTQAGEVNTGSFDPFDAIVPICRAHGAWVHVDGAFGLWAAASPQRSHLVRGSEAADSWTVDGHKWLNVPYDSGYVFVREGAHLRAALALNAAYQQSSEAARENFHFAPESSRRARGFATWAALRSLGRRGVANLVEHCCGLARRMADQLRASELVEVVNSVELNQVLVRFRSSSNDHDAFQREVIRRIQSEGTCWLGGTIWQGRVAARISISNAVTTPADIDRSAAAIIACVRAACA